MLSPEGCLPTTDQPMHSAAACLQHMPAHGRPTQPALRRTPAMAAHGKHTHPRTPSHSATRLRTWWGGAPFGLRFVATAQDHCSFRMSGQALAPAASHNSGGMFFFPQGGAHAHRGEGVAHRGSIQQQSVVTFLCCNLFRVHSAKYDKLCKVS